MSVIERWTIEGVPGLERRTLVNVSGRSISSHEQVRVVSEKDYDDLGQQLDGAAEALEEIFDDLEDAPMSSYWPGAYHARQVAEMALERLRGGQ